MNVSYSHFVAVGLHLWQQTIVSKFYTVVVDTHLDSRFSVIFMSDCVVYQLTQSLFRNLQLLNWQSRISISSIRLAMIPWTLYPDIPQACLSLCFLLLQCGMITLYYIPK